MLLPGRRRHLVAGVLWLALVLWGHQAVLQQLARWAPLAPAPPPRLAVQLVQPLGPSVAPPILRKPRPVAALGLGPQPAASAPVPAPVPAPEPPAPTPAPPPEPAPEPAASAPAAAQAREGSELGPEWPLSTRLSYAVVGHYQGAVHGDAEVEWLRQGSRYQVRLRVGIGPKLAPWGQRRLMSEGRLGAQGIAPERYDEETQFLWASPRRAHIALTPEELRWANGRRAPAPRGVQDSASQFVHLTWLLHTGREPSRAGHVITLPLVLPQGLSPWRYEIVGEAELDTPLGRISTWHLRPQPPLPPGALAAQVWLAPSYQHLPVRIRIEQGEAVWLELTLNAPPLQEQSQNAASAPASSPQP